MDLSKASNCISYDLIIAKLVAYKTERENVRLIYSYIIKGQKQCVRIKTLIATITKLFLVWARFYTWVYFVQPFNYWFFFFIEIASIHNFADDSTLSPWGEIVSKLNDRLELESNIAIDWLTKNEMIINPDHFQAILERNL